MRINTNSYSLQAQRQLGKISQAISRSLERLASGRRINRAADDVSGLALSTGLKAQSLGLAQIARNINQAFGYLNTADSALSGQLELLQRMRELAVQASSGTLSNSDRANLELEFKTLYSEFESITDKTMFNGVSLLSGDFEDIGIQAGLNKGEVVEFSLESTAANGVFYQNVTQSAESFGPSITTSGGSALSSLGANLAQIDGDGKADLYYQESDGLGDPSGVYYLYRGVGDGTFQAWKTFSLSAGSTLDFSYDFNSDGLADAIKDTGAGIEILLQSSSGEFAQQGLSTGLALSGLRYEDLDNDGDLDIWGRDAGNSLLYMYVNQGNGVFSSPVTTVSGAASYRYMKDLNGDGYSDFVSSASGTTTIRFNNSNLGFSSASTITMTAGFTAREFEDFDGDGDLDLLARNSTTGVALWLNNGSGSFSTPTTETFALSFGAAGFRVEDVNNDGRMDYVGLLSNGDLVTRLGQESGTFSTGTTSNFGLGANTIAGFSDLNGDGFKEILIWRSINGVYGLGLNNGTGSFSLNSTIYSGASNGIISFSDVNEDGVDDLLFKTNTTASIRFHTSGLNFSDANLVASQGISLAYQLIDVNGDGFKDVTSREAALVPANESFSVQFQQTEVVEEFVAPSVETQTNAINALEVLTNAMTEITARRAQVGAQQNRLESSLSASLITFENLEAARSQITHADIAAESAELVKYQVLQQAATAVLLQANSSLSLVISLLRQ